MIAKSILGAALLVAAAGASAQDSAQAQSAASLAYRNAVEAPPPGWTGPVFQLSHNYPTTDPGACPPAECPWLAMDVDFNTPIGTPIVWGGVWAQYIQSILDYVKAGQDQELGNDKGWNVQPDGKLRWFHVPWMAYDPTRGREFVHGLTNERTATLSDFHPKAGTLLLHAAKELHHVPNEQRFGLNSLPGTVAASQTKLFETWAFGVYNAQGAYAIGRSIGQNGVPIPGSYGGVQALAGLPFPQGTVVAKLLFSTATPADVPYLKGSPDWQADRHVQEKENFLCKREVGAVRLVQLDVAVVDSRSPTRWVFGTFAFNGNKQGKTAWDKLEPVGLQWGSDPWTFPAVPKADSVPPSQNVLNKGIGTPQHFGCNGRLAGPVDNKLSSCLSCHGGSFSPPSGVASTGTTTPPIFGYPGECTNFSADNVQYFNNVQFPMSYTGGQYPTLINLDTSLQMQVAMFEYGQYKEYGKPVQCKNSGD